MKKNWDKLTMDEIALYKESPDAFYDIVKGKYGMVREDVERRVKQLSHGYIL